MKTRFSFFLLAGILLMASCQKDPPKGNYSGRFEGKYTTETHVVNYTTDYEFEVKKSTKYEIYLKEKQSQMTSILQKKSNDSITGRIGFGNVYSPNGGPAINTISISGKHYKEGEKTYISGTFSTTFSIDGTPCPSEGTLVLKSY
jgi:hypothetical protein